MARFTSKKYRELTVKFSNRDRVKFSKGEVEVSGETADRLADFAERHPEYEIEQVEADAPEAKPQTPKQKAVAEAEALGLDTSGTEAQIKARIEEFKAAENADEDDENDDDSADEDDDEASDDDASDDA